MRIKIYIDIREDNHMKKIIYSTILIIILLFMFFRPSLAFEASKTGLLLWFHTIIPSLLPFMILSNLIIHLDIMEYITFFLAPFFSKLFLITPKSVYAIITGFLCGYPMGAKVTSDLVQTKKISLKEGQYILSFCNNVSPIFVINFIINESLGKKELLVPALIILYSSPILCGLLFRKKREDWNKGTKKEISELKIDFKILDISIMDGFATIVKLGGYIIMFAIISSILLNVFAPYTYVKSALVGITEITNGIHVISKASISEPVKFILLLAITSFGGLSSIAQTESMIKGAGLSIKRYILAKLITVMITLTEGLVYINLSKLF